MKLDNTVITICARGGSKGVKGKNIRELKGHPLIAYTISVAKRIVNVDDIVVSTDSPDIAAVAKKYGVNVPFLRPAELAMDDTPKMLAIRHAVSEIEKLNNKKYSFVVDLDVTAPIRTVNDVVTAFNILQEDKQADVVYSVSPARKNPYFNMVELDENGYAHLSKEGLKVFARQKAPKVYEMNASIYVYRRPVIDRVLSATDPSLKQKIYVMDEIGAIDIDTEVDWSFVEFLVGKGMVKLPEVW